MKTEKTPETITRDPFPNSKKIYVKGQIHDISVAMREISLNDTRIHGGPRPGKPGASEPNEPVTVYDTRMVSPR